MRESELDSLILDGIVKVVKSRYQSYNGKFFLSIETGQVSFKLESLPSIRRESA